MSRSFVAAPVPTPGLTDSSYAVLGMVALRGPSTAYDIKRALGRIADEFWTVPHVVHYRETARLEAAGLFSSRQEPHGRRRRVYRVTAAGRRMLVDWLARPAPSVEIRDVGQLKLLFAELGDPRNVVTLARDQAEQYRLRLEKLNAIDARLADRGDIAFRRAPIRAGQGVYRAFAQFWDDIARNPPASPATDRAKRRRRPYPRGGMAERDTQ